MPLLETIKSLVIRSRKHKDPNSQAQPLPNLVPKLATTPSDNNHASADRGNAQDPNTTPVHPEQPAPTSKYFANAQNCVFNNPTVATRRRLRGRIIQWINNAQDPNARLPTSNYFPNAQNFVINNSTAITHSSGIGTLQLLAQKRIPGAEVDSSARDPPPKCHLETRRSLRGRIIQWVNGPDRHWRMLWIIGPMGVGKSAVAQTIAEELKASGRLGASLFFSRPNHRDDPNGVIPTLAYQLAVKCPEYKRIITQRLADDVTILEKNRRTQFKELIIEPFHILMTRQSQAIREPFVIILDGLDECDGKEAQCEFIELISDHVRQVDEFPLLWMICSRPEWHLKTLLSHPDFQVACQREDIFIDDDEAQRDVARVLEAGFQEIRRRFHDRVDEDWPPQGSVRRIAVTASGHFAFASTMIKFVGNQHQSDPQTQLNICIRFLGGLGIPGALNPLHALDLLYRQIMSDIPPSVLASTMRLLSLLILYPNNTLPAYYHANFLYLDQATFYRSLQHLHSVIDVPNVADALYSNVTFYHASFADYLSDSLRSGSFSINKPVAHRDIAISSLKWARDGILAEAMGVGQDTDHTLHLHLEWDHVGMHTSEAVRRLRVFSSNIMWRACCNVSDEGVPRVVAELEHFDFRILKTHSKEMKGFGDFLAWLYKLGDRNNSLISVETRSDPAIQDTKTVLIRHKTNGVKRYLSIFGCDHTAVKREAKLWFLLGRPRNACHIEVAVSELSMPSSRDWPSLRDLDLKDNLGVIEYIEQLLRCGVVTSGRDLE